MELVDHHWSICRLWNNNGHLWFVAMEVARPSYCPPCRAHPEDCSLCLHSEFLWAGRLADRVLLASNLVSGHLGGLPHR